MERERKRKRAKEREKKRGETGEESPLAFFPLFRSLSFSLALHYLNAWNRLTHPEYYGWICSWANLRFLLRNEERLGDMLGISNGHSQPHPLGSFYKTYVNTAEVLDYRSRYDTTDKAACTAQTLAYWSPRPFQHCRIIALNLNKLGTSHSLSEYYILGDLCNEMIFVK